MTVSPQITPQVGISRRRQRLRAAELRENDLSPVCPHCYEINSTNSVVCAECGTLLGVPLVLLEKPCKWSTSA